jgi:hypothetical protein
MKLRFEPGGLLLKFLGPHTELFFCNFGAGTRDHILHALREPQQKIHVHLEFPRRLDPWRTTRKVLAQAWQGVRRPKIYGLMYVL